MRIPTVTVDRNGVAVVINRSDFRRGVDRLWGEAAPAAAEEPLQDEASERADLFAALSELGVKAGGRTSTEKLRAMLAEAQG